MAALTSLTELNNILTEWEDETYTEGLATTDPVPKLTRLSELFEIETEAYYKMDPDPFDDRHPGRTNPTCALGHLFKALFKNEDFMNKLVCEYLSIDSGVLEIQNAAARLVYALMPAADKKDVFADTLVVSYVLNAQRNTHLSTVACRLLYDILPGLETSVVFSETEGLVEQLLAWAENADEPLRTYSTGLLAGAMELQDVASSFKDKNSALVPIMLQRLHSLQKEMHDEYLKDEAARQAENQRYFSMFGTPVKTSTSGNTLMSPPRVSPYKGTVSSGGKAVGNVADKLAKENGDSEKVTDEQVKDKTDTNGAIDTEGKKDADNETNSESVNLNQVADVKGVNSVESADKNDDCSANTDHKPSSSQDIQAHTAVHNSAINGKTNDNVDNKDNPQQINGANKEDNSEKKVSEPKTEKTAVASDSQEPCCSSDITTRKAEDKVTSCDNESDSEMEAPISEITLEERKARLKRVMSPSFHREEFLQNKRPRIHADSFMTSDVSNSSWAEIEPYVIGSYKLEPLSLGMKQRLILQYLTPMGEYQELISAAFEHRAMDLIFYYINLKYNRDVRLAFEALKYLAVLLCHKKFAIEFLQRGGVQKLLDVYRPSIAATGVSLCLYYLSYFEDAMERVCLLSDHILTTLVNYVLWLMECSHDSSRCHAAMFFLQSFPFHIILSKFDAHDGLRRLFNVISTIEILRIDSTATPSDDHLFTMRQTVRHVCVALKKYFESHLVIKVKELQRSHIRTEGGSPQHETPAYKAMKITPDAVQENIEILMELMPIRQVWQPEAMFHKLGGITLLSQLVAMAPEWNNYTGKPETIKAALDVISICCVTPRSQLSLLQSIPLPENVSTPPIGIFIGLAEGELLSDSDVQKSVLIFIGLAEGELLPDSDVQKSALSVIINCVCGPLERLGGGVGRYMGVGSKKKVNWRLGEDVLARMWKGVRENNGIMLGGGVGRYMGVGSKKKVNWRLGEDVLARMWKGVRENNGIMVLLKLLLVKTPITDADVIRTLACKALVGMSRSETLKQIISKLPLFSTGQLQFLMKEPVLQDKHLEHVKFCRYATKLIEKVTGKENNRIQDATLDDIRRADIVAQSKIMYNEKELLQLIYDHLLVKGYQNTADLLQREADLVPHCSTPPPVLPANVFPPVAPANGSLFSPPQPVTPRPMNRSLNLNVPGASQSAGSMPASQPVFSSHPATSSVPQLPTTPTSSYSGHIKFTINRAQQNNTPQPTNSASRVQARCKYVKEEREGIMFSPAIKKEFLHRSQGMDYDISLDKIVTEYLRKQHALCPNPVVTCPLMSLFKPHQCPEPRGSNCAPYSFTARMARKMINPKYGGMDGSKLDRKFIYSRFKTVKTYKDTEDEGYFSCTFASAQSYLILGTYSGSLKLINTETSEETGSFKCHSSPVSHVEHSRDSKMVLTSSNYGIMNCSALWSWGADTLDVKYYFEDHHLEFSKHVQDRVIGTKDEVANIYDISTGQRVVKLYDSEKANNYKANRAIFSPSDDLVLNDGVLWDVRMTNAVHKFDKFNQYVSGDFHPAGLEIIINSEVWDVRTFRLLHTVPSLDQCQVRFNHMGDVMYASNYSVENPDLLCTFWKKKGLPLYCFASLSDATRVDEELDMEAERNHPYGSCFRTFDATNYSLIATIDVKSKSINDLCTDKLDTYLAVVEYQSEDIGTDGNVCKLYEIGRVKNEEDQQNEDEEEGQDDEDDDDEDDDDDDDDIDFENILFEEGDDDADEDGAEDGSELENDGEDGQNEEGTEEENEEEEDGEDDDDDAEIVSVDSNDDIDDDDDDNDDDDEVEFDIENAFFELG